MATANRSLRFTELRVTVTLRMALAILSLAFFMASGAVSRAHAAEYIRQFVSDVTVEKSGVYDVSEMITVNAEGDQIRRGIYRDFPLRFKTADGRSGDVTFKLKSVLLDGKPVAHHTESIRGGIRIYLGSADTKLSFGEHSFILNYETDRQVRYFDDHDEIYWNATGNFWAFPIDKAYARITLPEGVTPEDVTYYTGAYGSTAQNARSEVDGNVITFMTTKPLAPKEGLSVVVAVPKGAIDAPTASQSAAWFLSDYRNYFIGSICLILVFGYYLVSWLSVGRDPKPGVIVPRWEPPKGLSPALVSYIDNQGFGASRFDAIAATVVDLAVKGFVTIDKPKKGMKITRTTKPFDPALPPGQKAFLKAVDSAGGVFVVDKAHSSAVSSMASKFTSAITNEHRGDYFVSNALYTVGGVFLSVLAAIALFIFGEININVMPVLFMSVFAAIFIGAFSSVFAKMLSRRGKGIGAAIGRLILAGILGLVVVNAIGSFLVTLFTADLGPHDWMLVASIGGIVLLNILFFFAMGAPTPVGREKMDEIAG